ncbi:aminotransferase class I/II-fold pyridoxal phosphate-dependent enzyme [bacterium]|nr:aminotransferase class I/II-fold pyridoxal phosphate-dependent enzyme [bacterium]
MSLISTISEDRVQSLIASIARSTVTPANNIIPFVDAQAALAALFGLSDKSVSEVLVAGHAGPEIALAADRAGLTLCEHLGTSPFAADPDGVVERCVTGRETVYVANPNRITGSNFGKADLEMLAGAVPNGLLIVDEYYFDFYNISAESMLAGFGNIAVLRSFTSAFGIASSEAGFIMASPSIVRKLDEFRQAQTFTVTLYRILSTTIENSEARAMRVKLLNDEALRLAGELNSLKIQSRISPTDFLLLRVADPVRFGNALAAAKVEMLNLDGYPELKHYVRYTIQSPLNNDILLRTIRKMPKDHYAIDSLDRRLMRLRSGKQEKPVDGIDTTRVVERDSKAPTIREDETVFAQS